MYHAPLLITLDEDNFHISDTSRKSHGLGKGNGFSQTTGGARGRVGSGRTLSIFTENDKSIFIIIMLFVYCNIVC